MLLLSVNLSVNFSLFNLASNVWLIKKKNISAGELSVAGERFVPPISPSPPATDAQPRSLLSTFLLVNDPQRAGIPDEQMPVAKYTEGASVHVGEVEEIVEVIGAHGAEDGQELEGQVGGHLGSCVVEVAQGPGAGTDHQPPTGAQVPREGPSLHVGEDLPRRAGMGGNAPAFGLLRPARGPTSLPEDFQVPFLASSSNAGVIFCYLKPPAALPHPSLSQQPGKELLHPGVAMLLFFAFFCSFFN